MKLLKIDEVCALTRLGKTKIYQLIKEDRFPKQLYKGSKPVVWLEKEINEWINARAEERSLSKT